MSIAGEASVSEKTLYPSIGGLYAVVSAALAYHKHAGASETHQ